MYRSKGCGRRLHGPTPARKVLSAATPPRRRKAVPGRRSARLPSNEKTLQPAGANGGRGREEGRARRVLSSET